ncbi:MAG: YfhO family protein [Candidatus Omnitrophica bacterium]|nr:YfhO family protein [Candidatus Omnitrophota bacterium]
MKLVKSFLSIILLGFLNFIYFANIIFSNNIFSFRDLSRYYYPLRLFAFSQIKDGSFPFWNPYISCGHPILASLQSVILYPMSVVYLIFNFDFAFNFFIILHIFLGGVFFYLLMRELKFLHCSALISAVVFMFAGYLIGVVNLTTTLAAAIWFPLVFLFYIRALNQNKTFLSLVLAAIFLGLMLLGGEPTPLYSTLIILGLYSIAHLLIQRKGFLRVGLTWVSLVVIFMLLFSFQILPFWEFVKLSSRSQGGFEMATQWSFPPRDIINFIMPFFYGSLQFQSEGPMRQDWLLFSYLGILPLVLFFIAFIFRKDKFSMFFRFIFILGLIFVYGRFTPAYEFFYKVIPGFGFIRYPIKFFFISAVAFSFLAGAGWQEYFERITKQDKRFIKFIKSLFICAFIAALIFLLFYQFKDKIFVFINGYLKRFDDIQRARQSLIFFVNLFNFRRLLVFFILGSLFLFLGAKRKLKLGLIGCVTLGLIFIDLYGGKNIESNPLVSREVLHKETKNITLLKSDKSLFRVYTSAKMNKENEVLRGEVYETAFENSMDHLTPNRIIEFGIYDARGYESVHNDSFSRLSTLPDTAPLPSSTNILNMLNVKYILTLNEIKDPTCILRNSGSSCYLYENKNVLPRAYLVPKYIVLKKELDIANKLKRKDFLPQKQVVIEVEPKPVLSKANKPAGKESLEIIKYKPNEIIIEVNVLDRPKMLILSDLYYPGWEVFVDGKKDIIYKANFCLRAVQIAPGKHEVRFAYNPISFKIGLSISLTVAFILLIILFVIK